MKHTRSSPLSAAASLRAVLTNRSTRRLCLALLAAETSAPAFGVALYVFAYQRGGADTVGMVALVTMLPAAAAAPFGALVADRVRRELVVAGALLTRALLLLAIVGSVVAGGPEFVIYVLASLASIASRIVFPARIALVPAITASEEQRAATNAVTSTIENVGFVAGPGTAGLILAVSSPTVAFGLAAVATLAAAALAAGIRSKPKGVVDSVEQRVLEELVAGFRAVCAYPALRSVVGVYAVETAAFGMLMVVVVSLAVDVLGIGDGGVGALNGMLGAGGVAGGVVSLVLAGRLRAGGDLVAGSVLLGLPLALIALSPHPASAFALLIVAGAGGVVVDVACYTLVQEAVSDEVRARVFGVLEGVAVAAVALGSALGGFLVGSIGIRLALLMAGLVPLLATFAATRTRWVGRGTGARERVRYSSATTESAG